MSGEPILRRMRPDLAVQEIDPTRACRQRWGSKPRPEGDVSASYSGDRIASDQPIREPFQFGGHRWVCTGSGPAEWECYKLKHPSEFAGTPLSYRENSDLEDEARYRPTGWYDGMLIKVGRAQMVLVGPPVIFVPGEKVQGELF